MDAEYTPPPQLPPLLRGLLTTAHERHVDMINLVAGLSPQALNWRPFADSASLAGIALHIIDVEEYLAALAAGVGHEWSGENGSRMDEQADEATVLAEIERVDSAMKSSLAAVTPESLAELQPVSGRTVGEAVVEDLDHSAMHYGQMQLTRHAWEAVHPNEPAHYSHWR